MELRSVRTRLGAEVITVEFSGNVARTERRRPGELTSFSSIGRRPYNKGLGLKNIKIKVDNWGTTKGHLAFLLERHPLGSNFASSLDTVRQPSIRSKIFRRFIIGTETNKRVSRKKTASRGSTFTPRVPRAQSRYAAASRSKMIV